MTQRIITNEQQLRVGRLRNLMEERRIQPGTDYDFADLMEIVEGGAYCARYAAITYDETYTFLSLFESEEEACEHLAMALGDDVSGGSIEGVVDLDTGEMKRAFANVEVKLEKPHDSSEAPWPVLLDMRGAIESEIATSNMRVRELLTEMRSDLAGIEEAVESGTRAPTGIDPHRYFVSDTASRLVAALSRRQSSCDQLAQINHAIERKGGTAAEVMERDG